MAAKKSMTAKEREQRQEEIVQMWDDGYSCRVIGQQMNMSRQAVHSILVKLQQGAAPPGFARLVEKWPYPNARKWALEGGFQSVEDIARQAGVDAAQLRSLLAGEAPPAGEAALALTKFAKMEPTEFFYDPDTGLKPETPKVSAGQNRKEYQKQYYRENRERILARNKAWNQAHKPQTPEEKAQRAAYSQQYYATHREKRMAYMRRYNALNKERISAQRAEKRRRERAEETKNQLTLYGGTGRREEQNHG